MLHGRFLDTGVSFSLDALRAIMREFEPASAEEAARIPPPELLLAQARQLLPHTRRPCWDRPSLPRGTSRPPPLTTLSCSGEDRGPEAGRGGWGALRATVGPGRRGVAWTGSLKRSASRELSRSPSTSPLALLPRAGSGASLHRSASSSTLARTSSVARGGSVLAIVRQAAFLPTPAPSSTPLCRAPEWKRVSRPVSHTSSHTLSQHENRRATVAEPVSSPQAMNERDMLRAPSVARDP